MIRAPETTLDAADEAITLQVGAPPNTNPMAVARIKLKANTTVSAVVIVETRDLGATVWNSIAVIDMANLTITVGGNIALTNSTDYTFQIPDCSGLDYVRCRLVSISSGSITANLMAMESSEVPQRLIPISVGVAATAQTISSTSATALAVGANGTTNPVFSVNANTASVATGLTVIGAAAGSRVALTVISSGTNEGLSIDAKGSGTIRLNATGTGAIEFSRAAVPTANDGAALGTTTLGWSDLHLATGGVINWANGEVTLTETDANTLTFAGATVVSFGANTLNATGTRILQSYHTNLTSTNAVTVDSSERVKKDINPYKGDALATLRQMDVITYRHKDHLASDKVKLGMRAESVNEPLALDMIERSKNEKYPGINTYGLAALQTRAIQQLADRLDSLQAA